MLQEATPRFAEEVRPLVAGEYPYVVAAGLDFRFKGGVTWSRLPLGEAERLAGAGTALATH